MLEDALHAPEAPPREHRRGAVRAGGRRLHQRGGGQVHRLDSGVPVIVTYHPAYLLRALPEKAKAWQDLCLAMRVAEGQG